MRKILLVTSIVLLMVNIASAQHTRFGISAGPTYSTIFSKIADKTHSQDYRLGATFGLMLDVPMAKNGSFQPGFNYVTKGGKDDITNSGGQAVKTKTYLNYIEMPLNVVFRIPSQSNHVILGTGVTPALALSGKKSSVTGTTSVSGDVAFGDTGKDDYIGTDFGINGIAGYEFKGGFFVTANYMHGINRLTIGGDPDDKVYNRYFSLRLGFLIGKK